MSALGRSRKLRWAAPGLMGVVIAVLAVAPKVVASAPATDLPPLLAKDVIARAQRPTVKGLTGTIKLTTQGLNIPNLSSLTAGSGRSFDPTTFLSGQHSASVAASADGFRISYPSSLAEADLITNGRDLWTWQSQGRKVTHVTLPAKGAESSGGTAKANEHASGVQTPDQVAQDLLTRAQSTTVAPTTEQLQVAGQSAYLLRLTPKSKESTVGQVTIAVDGHRFLPLDIKLYARGSTSPVVEFGFSSVSYKVPPASTFTFTPPKDANPTTRSGPKRSAPDRSASAEAPDTNGEQTDPTGSPSPTSQATSQKPVIVGQGWETIAVFDNVRLPAQVSEFLGKGQSTPRGRMITTTLVNVLVLNNGKIAVGAVNPQSHLWDTLAEHTG